MKLLDTFIILLTQNTFGHNSTDISRLLTAHVSISAEHISDWCGWDLTEWRIKNNADDEYNYASNTWVRINEAWEHARLMRLRFDKTKGLTSNQTHMAVKLSSQHILSQKMVESITILNDLYWLCPWMGREVLSKDISRKHHCTASFPWGRLCLKTVLTPFFCSQNFASLVLHSF